MLVHQFSLNEWFLFKVTKSNQRVSTIVIPDLLLFYLCASKGASVCGCVCVLLQITLRTEQYFILIHMAVLHCVYLFIFYCISYSFFSMDIEFANPLTLAGVRHNVGLSTALVREADLNYPHSRLWPNSSVFFMMSGAFHELVASPVKLIIALWQWACYWMPPCIFSQCSRTRNQLTILGLIRQVIVNKLKSTSAFCNQLIVRHEVRGGRSNMTWDLDEHTLSKSIWFSETNCISYISCMPARHIPFGAHLISRYHTLLF